MSRLPEGWVVASLGEVVQPRGEKADPAILGDTPFVGMDHIEAHSSKLLGTQPVSELKSAVAIFHKDDILYGRLRPYLNKVYEAQFDGAASAEFIVLPPTEAVERRFLAWTMRCSEFMHFANLRSTGDRPRVKFDDLQDFTFLLPPFFEQRRIVDALDRHFTRTKLARDELTRIPTLIKHYKEAILQKAFSGELTANWRISHSLSEWRSLKAKDLFKWGSGKFLPKKNQNNGNIPVYGGNGVNGQHDNYLTEMPTMVIGRVGAQCGNIHKTTGPSWITDNAIYASSISDEVILDYAYIIFSHANLNENAGGSGQPFVNQEKLNEIDFPLPEHEEQKEIVRRIDHAMQWLAVVEAEHVTAMELLDHMDQALLAKAFRGELVPQDPSDEPASVLLERIRAERENQPKPKRGRKKKAA